MRCVTGDGRCTVTPSRRQLDAADDAPTFVELAAFGALDLPEPVDDEPEPEPEPDDPDPFDVPVEVPPDVAAAVLGSFAVDEPDVLDSPESLLLDPDSLPEPDPAPLPAGTMPPRPERESLW